MSRDNVDVVRAIHEGWVEGVSTNHLIAPDLEYVNPPYAVEPGTVKGRGTLFKVRDVYANFRLDPERFIDVGDNVVVIGMARGTGSSGVEIERRQGYVWTVKDGLAVRFQWFNDPAEAFEAVGLREP